MPPFLSVKKVNFIGKQNVYKAPFGKGSSRESG